MITKKKIIYLLSVFSFMSIGWGQDCDENMYWSDCGLPFYCNSTCLNPDPLPECDDYCEIGCFCNEGYIFNNDTYSECILIEDCSEQSLCDEGYVELWGECYTITFTTYLDLSEMGLLGEIPSEIGNLTNLTNLDLGGNQLSGEIPFEIGDLTNLTVLDFSGNQLSGEIPSEICNLMNLTELELGGNQLSGEIPYCIGNLTNLTFIHLEYNQFSGEIPSEIGNLTNLIWLNFVHNQLSGEIPSSICNIDMNWSNPDNFNIYENQFCPPYPLCIEDYVGEQDTSDCFSQNCCEAEQLANDNCTGLGCYIPQCTLDCNWEPMQCWISTGYCWCVDENGIEIDGTSTPSWQGFPECEEECLLGDINFDLILNVLDIISMVNLILGGDYGECSDTNSDGTLNILDVVTLVNLIFSSP